MMERDRRLTGSLRGQSVRSPFILPLFTHALCQTDPIAPKTFATNSVWETETVNRTFI